MDDFFKDFKPVKREDSPQDDQKRVKPEEPPAEEKLISPGDYPLSTPVQPASSAGPSSAAADDHFFHDLKAVRTDDSQSKENSTERESGVEPQRKPEGGTRPRNDDAEEEQDEPEKDADNDEGEAESAPRQPTVLLSKYAADRDWKGLIRQSWELTRGVLSNPKDFFDKMPVSGGLSEPVIYLVIIAMINALVQAIMRLNVLGFFTSFFTSLIAVGIGAGVAQLIFAKLGGKGTLEATVRVFAFSRATLLIAWIWLGNIPIGGILAGLYSIYLNVIGMQKVHQLEDRKTVALVLVVIAAIGFSIKLRFSL